MDRDKAGQLSLTKVDKFRSGPYILRRSFISLKISQRAQRAIVQFSAVRVHEPPRTQSFH